MALYCGIDLHSNNNVPVVIDDSDKVIFEKRLPNDLGTVIKYLSPYRSELAGVAVESTFNWYWLVDGLSDAGFPTMLVNTAAVEQYNGIKYTDDQHDARWIAHMMRLAILPTGYIYPKEERAVRDLLRKRAQLVRHRTAHILSIQNQYWRNTGGKVSSNAIKQLDGTFDEFDDPNIRLALGCNYQVIRALDAQIKRVECAVKRQVKLRPAFVLLQTADGIGLILALTIMLETGDIGRFPSVGQYASYCRCVSTIKTSNGKKKGKGNTKNGNKYLDWAFIEAANFMRRYNARAKRFHQKKAAKTNTTVATKALAHKIARGCYYVMRDQVPFDAERLLA